MPRCPMSRVTLRLPEELHDRLRDVAHRTGVSLNEVIVSALRDALTCNEGPEAGGSLLKQVRLARAALTDLAVDVDTAWIGAEFGRRAEVPTAEELIRSLPR